jgi:hypothetical protein
MFFAPTAILVLSDGSHNCVVQTFLNSQAFIFRCELPEAGVIRLSSEHSEFRYFSLSELGSVQRRRVEDYLNYQSAAVSGKF